MEDGATPYFSIAYVFIVSQIKVQYNMPQIRHLREKFSFCTLLKSVKICSISNKLETSYTVFRVPQIDPAVAVFLITFQQSPTAGNFHNGEGSDPGILPGQVRVIL